MKQFVSKHLRCVAECVLKLWFASPSRQEHTTIAIKYVVAGFSPFCKLASHPSRSATDFAHRDQGCRVRSIPGNILPALPGCDFPRRQA
jgi:hypothetical protein